VWEPTELGQCLDQLALVDVATVVAVEGLEAATEYKCVMASDQEQSNAIVRPVVDVLPQGGELVEVYRAVAVTVEHPDHQAAGLGVERGPCKFRKLLKFQVSRPKGLW